MADRPGKGQMEWEVTQLEGQGKQLQARLVRGKTVTGTARPIEGVLASFDPLLGRALLVGKWVTLRGAQFRLVTVKPIAGKR